MLETQLDRLTASELVRRLTDPEPAYRFKNELVQDVALSSLLLGERRRLHRLVGETLERLYPERRTELSPLLAGHFAIAGRDDKTLTYAALAGDAAARINANAEAFEHYTQALAAADKIGASGELVRELFLKRGRVLELQGDFDRALENYAELTRAGEARGERALELAAMIASATIYSIPSTRYDEPRAQALSDRALALARELDDKDAQAKILWNLMLMLSRVGKGFHSAMAYGQEALRIARENDLRELVAYLLNDLSTLYVFHGQRELGEAYNLEARAMWQEFGNLPMLGSNLGYAVMNHLFTGEFDKAIAESNEALRISGEINNSWNEAFAQTWIGEAYMERGEIETAVRVMLAAIELGAQVFPPTLVMTRSDLARLYTGLGYPERGVSLASEALAVAGQKAPPLRLVAVGALAEAYLALGKIREAGELLHDAPDIRKFEENPWYVISVTHAHTALALSQNELERAAELSDALLTYLRSRQARHFVPRALLASGRILMRMGQLDEAEENLDEGRIVAEEINAPWSLWQVLAQLARVRQARGNAGQAETSRAQARAVIESIAERTPADLRARFLQHATSEL